MSGRSGHDLDDGPVSVTTAEYGKDFYRWATEQASLLRSGNVRDADLTNIAEEIEDLGRSDYAALVSELTILLQHMLKWDHQQQRRSRSWEASIREHRRRALRRLNASPSLRTRLPEAIEAAFEDGRDQASAETDLPMQHFPASCPYPWTDIMGRPYDLDSK